MDRLAEIINLRSTIAAQEAWGKFSVRNHNRLAELEAGERVERWGFDWQKLALTYCGLFWAGTFAGIWVYLSPLIRAMINHQ